MANTQKNIQAMKGKSRSSTGDWPDLEMALFEWQQRMEQKKAIITEDILKEKARQLWDAMSQYDDIEMPKRSNGWLDGFKKRYKIKEYVQRGEAGSAATNVLERGIKKRSVPYDAPAIVCLSC